MPAKEGLNIFSGGCNKDVSKIALQKNTYLDARNFRLITEAGSSSYSLENVLGDRLFFTIPNTSPVVKITVFSTLQSANTILMWINNVGVGAALFTPISDNLTAVRDEIVTYLNDDVALTNHHIVAVPSGNFDILIYATEGVTSLSVLGSQWTTASTEIVPYQTGIQIIGWTMIREDFILLTTADDTVTGGPGQIWRLSYDKSDLTIAPVLTLLYNNNLNFSIEHPVYENGRIVGRYENTYIKRIYWTDNHNVLRKFNTADPNGFGIIIENINLRPSIDFNVPIFRKIEGGNLVAGIYQFAYRLKTTGGTESQFSPVSNIIPLNDDSETAVFADYIGTAYGTATSKGITMRITGVDTDYEWIEVIAIYRGSGISNYDPDIYLLAQEPVPSDGIHEFTFTTHAGLPTVTLEEYVMLGVPFTHCKALTTKDNALIPGNVRNDKQEFEYDARAFRYDDSQVTYDYGALPDVENDINPDQNIYKFQNDGSTIGGTGINISYKIKQADAGQQGSLLQDTITSISGHVDGVTALRWVWTETADSYNLGVSGQDYVHSDGFPNYQNPLLHDLFKGYQRRELYRFAILFYDKQGNALFPRWIGDIQMPGVFEKTVGGVPYASLDYPLITQDSYGSSYTHPLYIEFTVNIPQNIRHLISGYSIVRVERKDPDKSILGQGIMTVVTGNGTDYSLPHVPQYSEISDDPVKLYHTGNFPEVFFGSSFPWLAGDKVEVLCGLHVTDDVGYHPIGGDINIHDIKTRKLYSVNSNKSYYDRINQGDVTYGVLVARGDSNTNNDGSSFFNTAAFNLSWNDPFYNLPGCRTMLMKLEFPAYTITDNALNPSPSYYLVNYVRPRGTGQYGGQTISQKANNDYMSCGHFQPINENSPSSFTFDLFGGDTFVSIFDVNKIQNSETIHFTWSNQNFFFPVESILNTDMRNRDGETYLTLPYYGGSLLSGAMGEMSTGFTNNWREGSSIPIHYTFEKTIRPFINKPVDFQEVEEYDNRIYASRTKINGEKIDMWADYEEEPIDVDGVYGPINNLVKFKDKVFYFQDTGFGVVAINPRTLIPDSSGTTLQLGVGNLLQDYDYVSTEIGCHNQSAMCQSDNAMYFFDIFKKKMYKFTGEGGGPLSDIKGMQSYFANELTGNILTGDNPLTAEGGIAATYDYRFNEAVFTFKSDNNITIAYNEQVGAFVGFYDYAPSMYINDGTIIFSPNPNSASVNYIHNEGNYCNFYGTLYPSTIEFVTNELPKNTKVFDNLEWYSELWNSGVDVPNQTFNVLQCVNDYQDTGVVTLNPALQFPFRNVRRKERSWKMATPRNTTRERMRDKYNQIKLTYNNTNNYRLVLHWVKSLFKVSPR